MDGWMEMYLFCFDALVWWQGSMVSTAVTCPGELLHLAWKEKRQKMSNNYQGHLIHPQTWCCCCVTSPPNPHICSDKWPPELRAAPLSLRKLPSATSPAVFSSVTAVDVNRERSLLDLISFLTLFHSLTALIWPTDVKTIQGRDVDCRDGRRRGCIITGGCIRFMVWVEREAFWLFNFHFVLVLYINRTFSDSFSDIKT